MWTFRCHKPDSSVYKFEKSSCISASVGARHGGFTFISDCMAIFRTISDDRVMYRRLPSSGKWRRDGLRGALLRRQSLNAKMRRKSQQSVLFGVYSIYRSSGSTTPRLGLSHDPRPSEQATSTLLTERPFSPWHRRVDQHVEDQTRNSIIQ